MIRKGERYHRDSSLTFRDVTPSSNEVNAAGEPMRVGEAVIVPFSKCTHIATRVKVHQWTDVDGETHYDIERRAKVYDPNMTDYYIPSITTRSNAGYFPPRKARSNAPFRHVEYRDHQTGEWKSKWTDDYYTMKSYWIEDAVVYTRIDYILPEHAQRILERINGKEE